MKTSQAIKHVATKSAFYSFLIILFPVLLAGLFASMAWEMACLGWDLARELIRQNAEGNSLED